MLHLSAQDVTVTRGNRLLVQGLSTQLWRGEAVWLKGVNGGGKTSLLRVLAGLSRPMFGEVSRHVPIRWLGHQLGLKEDLTALEAVTFLSGLHDRIRNKDDALSALCEIGLSSCLNLPVRKLSQGQKKGCALATLLMAPRESLWLLDEPFDALDLEGIERLLAMLDRHRRGGGSVLFTSHIDAAVPGAQALELGDPTCNSFPAP